MTKKLPALNITFMGEQWSKTDGQEWAHEAISASIPFFEESFQHTELGLVFSNDAHVRELNRDFRQKDKPTNVLSFEGEWDSRGGELGDIILAFETVKKEAEDGGLSLRDHTVHLLVHGFLHLMGYDHQDELEAEDMESLEAEILETLDIDNPYEDL